MDAADFLKIAEQLHGSKVEAERRTAIGRAYYALYNELVTMLSAQDVYFEREANHARLVYYLSRCSPSNAPTLGEDLKTLRNQRNDADYDMQKSISPHQSELAFKKARTALERFHSSDIKKLADCIRFLPPYTPGRRQR